MRVEFIIERGQPRVKFDGRWTSLSLFLESDANFSNVRSHISLKKSREWEGNTSTVQLVSGSKFEIYSKLTPEFGRVTIYQKQLLNLMDEWDQFVKDKKTRTFSL